MSDAAQVRFQGAAPTRCPFCHDAVDRAAGGWVACEGCLARHHAGCWAEHGACGACGEAAFVGPPGAGEEATPSRPRASARLRGVQEGVSVYDMALQGEQATWLTADPGLGVLAERGGDEVRFALRVHNATERPRRVRLHEPPDWLEAPKPPELEVAPGETAVLPLACRLSVTPKLHDCSLPPDVLGNGQPYGGVLRVACDEAVREVKVEVVRPFSDRTLRAWSVVFAVLCLAPILLFVVRRRARPPARVPGESDAAWLLRARAAAEAAHQERFVRDATLGWAALVALALLAVALA
ncbi:MAG: hypothetical protein M9894_27995 [Planctomycetes bacterium]|nr:hypothetical protein [Planctomycetota bacterium]